MPQHIKLFIILPILSATLSLSFLRAGDIRIRVADNGVVAQYIFEDGIEIVVFKPHNQYSAPSPDDPHPYQVYQHNPEYDTTTQTSEEKPFTINNRTTTVTINKTVTEIVKEHFTSFFCLKYVSDLSDEEYDRDIKDMFTKWKNPYHQDDILATIKFLFSCADDIYRKTWAQDT